MKIDDFLWYTLFLDVCSWDNHKSTCSYKIIEINSSIKYSDLMAYESQTKNQSMNQNLNFALFTRRIRK